MPTIQIVGIAVATVIVVLLVVALIVTRKSGGAAEETYEKPERSSFLDSPPSDTLAKLGAPERTPTGPAIEPLAPVAPESTSPTAVAGTAASATTLELAEADGAVASVMMGADDEAETTGEMPAVPAEPEPAVEEPVAAEPEPLAAEPEPEAAEPEPLAAEPEPTIDSEPATPTVTESEPVVEEPLPTRAPSPGQQPPASDRLVPLSSIIVTTSTKIVDLDDPEIRRMLADLVTFEIDQATQFREQGQNLDAVLQLTEAEKICRALGKEDTAHEIGDMMRGLRA